MRIKTTIVLSALLGLGLGNELQAQHFTGYNYTNYQTAGGVVFNPANIAGSKYKVNVNLLSVNAGLSSNAMTYRSGLRMDNYYKLGFSPKNSDAAQGGLNADILGPSVMVTLNPKSAIAITTRFRALGNANNLDHDVIDGLANDNVELFDKDFTLNNQLIKAHAFADIGAAYSRILYNTEQHTIKAGITAKYVMGMGAAGVRFNNLNVNLEDENNFNQIDGDLTLRNSPQELNSGKGWGLDIGGVYEWKPMDKAWMAQSRTPYLLRASLAVADIGQVRYKSDRAQSYRLNSNGSIPLSAFDLKGGEDFQELIDRLVSDNVLTPREAANASGRFTASLPTTVKMNVDYQVYKNLFLNADGNISLISKNSIEARYLNTVALTPRYELKWASIYSPVSYNELKNVSWGVGFNFGSFYVGSGSVLSSLLDKKHKTADVHVGWSVPIHQRVKRVKEEPAPEPVEEEVVVPVDTDGDGVADKDDKCPDVAGLAKYNGCPIPDSDGDGVNDEEDNCQFVPGLAKYKGCPIPDTDGDGVNDEEDKCPTVKGTVANNGCPEIKAEVVKQLNLAARKVLFASGSDKLLPSSHVALNDVAQVLFDSDDVNAPEGNASLHLQVEGHTDNTGSDAINNTLSQKRAESVKAYLVKKGIEADRIQATGFGSKQPIDSNKTPAGRANNRRVVLKLHY